EAALAELLASDRTPTECMQLAHLDGFLTALVIGPEFVPPSRWLPEVWGRKDAAFKDGADALAAMRGGMAHHNRIATALGAFPLYSAIVGRTADGAPDPSEWCSGFLSGIWLEQGAWMDLFHSDERILLAPILGGLPASTREQASFARLTERLDVSEADISE